MGFTANAVYYCYNIGLYTRESLCYIGVIMVKYCLEGKEQIVKEVKPQSTSGIVYVPRKWVGHKVAIILDVVEEE